MAKKKKVVVLQDGTVKVIQNTHAGRHLRSNERIQE